jgi:NAD/NADP transhydrogenase beta subunit
MGTGYADIDNPLFYKENTEMLLGSARESCERILANLVKRDYYDK